MTRSFTFALLSLLSISAGLVACHRDAPPSPLNKEAASSGGNVSSATTVPTRALPPATLGPQTTRKAKSRVVAIGDLHGDLHATIAAFRLAAVIDETEKWIGNDTTVVQTGDVLDRGDQERALLDWLDKIEARAKEGGGQLLRLNGNHEVMNVAGDLRYVSPKGFADFADSTGTLPPEYADANASVRGRYLAFLPGRPWAMKLSRFPVVMVVGDTVFAHGGLRSSHVDYGLERMNAELSAWMRGEAALPKALQSDDSPFWVRDYGDSVTAEACAALEQALSRLSAVRLVVGHTPQKDGITFACDGKVARIDVGLSAHYGNRAAAVLEIRNGKMRAIDSETDKKLSP